MILGRTRSFSPQWYHLVHCSFPSLHCLLCPHSPLIHSNQIKSKEKYRNHNNIPTSVFFLSLIISNIEIISNLIFFNVSSLWIYNVEILIIYLYNGISNDIIQSENFWRNLFIFPSFYIYVYKSICLLLYYKIMTTEEFCALDNTSNQFLTTL